MQLGHAYQATHYSNEEEEEEGVGATNTTNSLSLSVCVCGKKIKPVVVGWLVAHCACVVAHLRRADLPNPPSKREGHQRVRHDISQGFFLANRQPKKIVSLLGKKVFNQKKEKKGSFGMRVALFFLHCDARFFGRLLFKYSE